MKKSILTLTIAVLLLAAHQSQSAGRQPKLKADTLTALQQTLPYNDKLPKTFPDFTYQNATDKPLVNLREKYKLDSVAGNGTDVERVIRLLAWFHKQVPHGDVRNLPVLNAENIIDTYRAKKYPQGCYGLSIGMNEILLSMGYSSRTVICFSNKYPEPQGGHVINTVFIKSLNKWIYIDPQDNVYLKDEKGNFLSIAEVRERLVKRLPIVLNPTANYHDVPTKKEEYLDQFMGEHLYRMICPVNSCYNSQTRDGKVMEYIELLPYASVEPPFTMFESTHTNKEQVYCYHTANDQLFWGKP
jgi:hypothetical protein